MENYPLGAHGIEISSKKNALLCIITMNQVHTRNLMTTSIVLVRLFLLGCVYCWLSIVQNGEPAAFSLRFGDLGFALL